jgi:hypothetical protein
MARAAATTLVSAQLREGVVPRARSAVASRAGSMTMQQVTAACPVVGPQVGGGPGWCSQAKTRHTPCNIPDGPLQGLRCTTAFKQVLAKQPDAV